MMVLAVRSFSFMSPIALRLRKAVDPAENASARMYMMKMISAIVTSSSTIVKACRRRMVASPVVLLPSPCKRARGEKLASRPPARPAIQHRDDVLQQHQRRHVRFQRR